MLAMGVVAAAVGAGSATTGGVVVATGVVSVTAGAPAVVVGTVSATAGVGVVVLGTVSATAGVLAVAGFALAVAVAQCSEIILTPVTATPLSGVPELVAVVFDPVTSMSWPRCGFRSTVLLAILKV